MKMRYQMLRQQGMFGQIFREKRSSIIRKQIGYRSLENEVDNMSMQESIDITDETVNICLKRCRTGKLS